MLASAAFWHLTLWGWLVVVLTTNQSPLYGAFSVNRCVRAYREKASAAYARTQQNTRILLLWGSCPPAVWRKVGLHKGFDAHKAPDTPPGRVNDIVGVFQIVPALVGNQGIAEPSGLNSVQAVLLTPHLVDLVQLFGAGTGIRLQADVPLGFEEIEHIVVVPLHQFPVALGMVAPFPVALGMVAPFPAGNQPDHCHHLFPWHET